MSDTLRLRLVFAGLMSCLMSVLMTGWVTWLNLGFVAGFAGFWSQAFVAAWPPAFAIVVVFGPCLQRVSQRLALGERA
ncbi:DUF2798 domain-containing protein [Crenobacter cavernae]|uniref:DUF2798 domain-containing protein n=1 Tax=Crenobacter cavernae TaxID=2290923 RepID=A0ABY0FGM6_9NEIS|nr:DUF2798 domain-containing protein [Crenobacter cavernae]RXZ44383.1 DUF2798 domain-containing protein [Crenobacter cavernae]